MVQHRLIVYAMSMAVFLRCYGLIDIVLIKISIINASRFFGQNSCSPGYLRKRHLISFVKIYD